MTPEQQRMAIAEACGWKMVEQDVAGHPDNPFFSTIPDYLNDLNAMHEAEKLRIIGTEHESDYCMYLYENAHQCFATAAQRTEAFLKTLNLWTES
mgnify:CR=1 FL=1